MATRTWHMYAGRRGSDGALVNIGTDPRYPRMHGHADIVAVEVAETPEGPYWGFIFADRETDTPVMIYEHETLFRMCFPYGHAAEEERGTGRVVRLAVTERALP